MTRVPVLRVAGLADSASRLPLILSPQQRLDEGDRLIADLRGRVNDSSATGADAGPAVSGAQPSSGDSPIPGNADLAAMQARLEALAERIEPRLT